VGVGIRRRHKFHCSTSACRFLAKPLPKVKHKPLPQTRTCCHRSTSACRERARRMLRVGRHWSGAAGLQSRHCYLIPKYQRVSLGSAMRCFRLGSAASLVCRTATPTCSYCSYLVNALRLCACVHTCVRACVRGCLLCFKK
jgi:hypothetical protein